MNAYSARVAALVADANRHHLDGPDSVPLADYQGQLATLLGLAPGKDGGSGP